MLAGFDEAGGAQGAIGRSITGDGGVGRRTLRGAACGLAAENHQRLVLPRRDASFRSHGISTRQEAIFRFSFLFPRRGFSAVFRGALPAARYLHFRRAGIGTVALAPDGIPEIAEADGGVNDLPGRDGHAFADADGLSQRAAAAAVEICAGAGDRQGNRPLPGHARIFRGSDRVCGGGHR